MENIEEALTFRDRFYAFFVTDDVARWKTIGLIILTGTILAAIDVLFFNSPLDDLVTFLTVWVLICYVLSIAWYCWFKRLPEVESVVPARRLILQTAWALVAFVVAWRIPRAEARPIERALEKAADGPSDPKNIAEAKAVLTKAMKAGLQLSPSVTRDVGLKFTEAAKTNPEALGVATACVAQYTSSLTPDPCQSGCGKQSWGNYNSEGIPGEPTPDIKAYGGVPFAEAAQFYVTDKGPNPNTINQYAPARVVISRGGVALDFVVARNVTFTDCHLWYDGGPLEFTNVYLARCKVDVISDSSGRRLLVTLFRSSPPYTFTLENERPPT